MLLSTKYRGKGLAYVLVTLSHENGNRPYLPHEECRNDKESVMVYLPCFVVNRSEYELY